jgi:hypothetical protein
MTAQAKTTGTVKRMRPYEDLARGAAIFHAALHALPTAGPLPSVKPIVKEPPRLPPTARTLHSTMKRMGSQRLEKATNAQLAEASGLCLATVVKSIRPLVELGAIHITRPGSKARRIYLAEEAQ